MATPRGLSTVAPCIFGEGSGVDGLGFATDASCGVADVLAGGSPPGLEVVAPCETAAGPAVGTPSAGFVSAAVWEAVDAAAGARPGGFATVAACETAAA